MIQCHAKSKLNYVLFLNRRQNLNFNIICYNYSPTKKQADENEHKIQLLLISSKHIILEHQVLVFLLQQHLYNLEEIQKDPLQTNQIILHKTLTPYA